MLARPEPGTREHILLWLASQPPERTYNWCDARECACGHYVREVMGKSNMWWVSRITDESAMGPFRMLNSLAHHADNYGGLYELALEIWKE